MQKTMERTQAMIGHFAEANRILEKYGCCESRLIPILQEIQSAYRYLSQDMITYVADSLGVPPSRVYGVATFYAHFSLSPKGKYVIRLCDGTACHVKKSHAVLNMLREKLNLSGEKQTSDDLLFTVETVSCLGACGLAPVMLVNEDVHGQMTPEKAEAIIDDIIAREAANK